MNFFSAFDLSEFDILVCNSLQTASVDRQSLMCSVKVSRS